MRWETGPIAWSEPWWLIAIAPAALVLAYYYRHSLDQLPPARRRLSATLRTLLILCLVLALVAPSWLSPTEELCVVLAVDRSESAVDAKDPNHPETGTTAEADRYIRQALSQPHGALVLGFAFGANQGPVAPVSAAGVQPATLDYTGTDLAGAIRAAASAVPPGRAPRVVLITDGIPTTGDVLQAALRAAVPVDIVLTKTDKTAVRTEVQMTRIQAPLSVRPGETFKLEAEVRSTHEDKGRLMWFQAGQMLSSQPVVVHKGENRYPSPEVRAVPGVMRMSARLVDLGMDYYQDNNSASAWVKCAGKPRVLIVAGKESQAAELAETLRQAEFEVDPVRPVQGLPADVSELSDYDLLVLVNVPLTDRAGPVPTGKLDAIHSYVQDLGGGLLVVGGNQSFSLGGYARTKLEDLLPVSSAFERGKDRPQLALVLVIDRSGSMNEENKIVLAREAAQTTVAALSPRDQIGVLVFDTQLEWTYELRPCGDKPDIINRIETIKADGGTLILPALDEAVKKLELNARDAKHRHIILLTDGRDNEISAAGPFEQIATRAFGKKITISTVGVGGDADQDLLAKTAAAGGGRFYFTNDPNDLPRFFQKEAAEASGDAFQKKDTFVRPRLQNNPVTGGLDWESAPPLAAYVRTKIKPGAEEVLVTELGPDQPTLDPLLAWWRTGLGRVAAFTGGVDAGGAGRWLSEWRGRYAKLFSQLAGHLQRSPEAKGMVMQQLVEENGVGTFIVDVIDPLSNAFVNQAECDAVLVAPDEQGSGKVAVTQTAPGRYRGTFPCRKPGDYLVSVVVNNGGQRLHMTRHLNVGFSPEHQIRQPDEELLREVARRTGGRYNPQPEELFAPATQPGTKTHPLWPALLAAAAVLLLADVASRRLPTFRHQADGPVS